MSNISFFALVASATICFSVVVAQSEQVCGVNETKYPCGKRCEDRCNADKPSFCKGIRCEGFSCRCKNGFARDPETNKCVVQAECPVTGCAKGEILGACGRTCEGTCASPTEPEICQRIRCSDRKCRCDLSGGFVRKGKNGPCVRIGEC